MILATGFVFSDALAPLNTLPSLRCASRMVAFLAAQFMAAGIRPLVLTRGYGDDEWRQACERIACPAALVVGCAHARTAMAAALYEWQAPEGAMIAPCTLCMNPPPHVAQQRRNVPPCATRGCATVTCRRM